MLARLRMARDTLSAELFVMGSMRLLLPLLVALTPGVAEASDEAQAIWQSECARCHRDLAALAQRLPDGGDASAVLDAFLSDHHAPDARSRELLIAWLLAQRNE